MDSNRLAPSAAEPPESSSEWSGRPPLEQFGVRVRELFHAQSERTLLLRRQVAAQLQRVQLQLDTLESARDELQLQLQARSRAQTDDGQEIAALQARLDMALKELHDVKAGNVDAATPQNSVPKQSTNVAAVLDQRFDWESQKRRLLEQLESDFDLQEPAQKRDRLTIEGVLRATDQVIVEKDQEITELRRLLENQAGNIGSVAVGAAAVAELLDQDDLVREERQNLQRLQDEWRDKLRRAEVEISVERAKIARERNELDEKLRAIERARTQASSAGGNSSSTAKKKGRAPSRWFTRLGLQEDGD